MKALLAALLVGVISTADAAGAAERVRNGAFEQGNSGFTSGLTYSAPGNNALAVAGTYSIGDNPSKFNTAFPVVTDRAYGHESGMGDYLIANGSTKANSIVWQQDGIAVFAGNEYLFDSWFATLADTNRPVFEAFVKYGGEEHYLGTWRAERGVGVWQGMEARFTPASNLITIIVRNRTGADRGNDFALDAVRVLTPAEWAKGQPGGAAAGAVPEPATWALLVTGFGVAGTALRNRHRATKGSN